MFTFIKEKPFSLVFILESCRCSNRGEQVYKAQRQTYKNMLPAVRESCDIHNFLEYMLSYADMLYAGVVHIPAF